MAAIRLSTGFLALPDAGGADVAPEGEDVGQSADVAPLDGLEHGGEGRAEGLGSVAVIGVVRGGGGAAPIRYRLHIGR